MPPKSPLTHTDRMRYAYARACGFSASEGGRLLGIHVRTAQKIDHDPDVVTEVERVKAERGAVLSVEKILATFNREISAMLPDGSPDEARQLKGATEATKALKPLIDLLAQKDEGDTHRYPEGTKFVFPE